MSEGGDGGGDMGAEAPGTEKSMISGEAASGGFINGREGRPTGQTVVLTPEEEAARKKRNVAIAWGLVGCMVLIFLITVLRLSQNVAGGAAG